MTKDQAHKVLAGVVGEISQSIALRDTASRAQMQGWIRRIRQVADGIEANLPRGSDATGGPAR